jgi:hypothetical protein
MAQGDGADLNTHTTSNPSFSAETSASNGTQLNIPLRPHPKPTIIPPATHTIPVLQEQINNDILVNPD